MPVLLLLVTILPEISPFLVFSKLMPSFPPSNEQSMMRKNTSVLLILIKVVFKGPVILSPSMMYGVEGVPSPDQLPAVAWAIKSAFPSIVMGGWDSYEAEIRPDGEGRLVVL